MLAVRNATNAREVGGGSHPAAVRFVRAEREVELRLNSELSLRAELELEPLELDRLTFGAVRWLEPDTKSWLQPRPLAGALS